MALLIDGYNLLNVTDIVGGSGAGTALHRTRLALLDFLAGSLSERDRRATTIVFDAAGAPPGLPQMLTHEEMGVRFARGYSDADALLEELIEAHPAPRALVVVSSDHRVQRAARRRGAAYVDSDRWFAELQAARRAESTSSDAPAKPIADVDELANPFPPGYAEDLLDDG